MTSKGSDQTVRMHRLIGGFADRTYHIENLMLRFISRYLFFHKIFGYSDLPLTDLSLSEFIFTFNLMVFLQHIKECFMLLWVTIRFRQEEAAAHPIY